MFVLKKILAAFFMPPGLITLLLFLSAFFLRRKKAFLAARLNLVLGVIVWILSLFPVSDFLTRGLESDLPRPRVEEADVVIVLSGYGERLGPGIQLQKRLGVPILFSGYFGLKHSASDRDNFYQSLESAGIPRHLVLVETQSRDTFENLRQARNICRRRGFRRPIIVSSAFHGKRILLTLRKLRFPADLYPVDFKVSGRTIRYTWRSALPEAQALLGCSTALNEYLGLLFYKIVY
jgi:uncharacterized SAM-binding protein YcdF (DUF218 family)